MKKLFFSLVVLVSIGFLWFKVTDLQSQKVGQVSKQSDKTIQKKEILRFAIVADSHNENENLKKALAQAKSAGASFVIGLGDYTDIGTEAELRAAKKVFDTSKLDSYFTAGDHDLWDSRNKGLDPLANFRQVFGKSGHVFVKDGVEFIIIDNSDNYKGISDSDWQLLNENLSGTATPRLTFVFSHKTPYHPQSSHIMGSENGEVAKQAQDYLNLLESKKVNGFFSGDLHFFAEFISPAQAVRITTIGAVAAERNFQGPRFSVVKVYSDYSWDTQDLEIK